MIRHSRGGGNPGLPGKSGHPAAFVFNALGPRLRGDGYFCRIAFFGRHALHTASSVSK
jgi:hypothetical protein